MRDLTRMKARYLCAIVAAGACADRPAAAPEPIAVPVEPPPEPSEVDEEPAALPERDGGGAEDRNAVWVEGSFVCVNESGTDPNSGAGFARCHRQPDREVLALQENPRPCAGCYYTLDEPKSNEQRAAGKRSACCFAARWPPVKGRPLRDRGRALLAPAVHRGGWADAVEIDVRRLSPALRTRLAELWTEDALLEHASVGSFAQLSLDLLALGAPPELLERASRAALDEIAHAKLCFGLARAYANTELGPGSLPLPRQRVSSPERLAEELFVDGCVGETLAAIEARHAAKCAKDPNVCAVLERIARDEEEHAELAWRALAWLVQSEPTTRSVIERALAELVEPSRVEGQDGLAEHGRLDGATRRALACAALAEIVRPCARALLDQPGRCTRFSRNSALAPSTSV